MPTFDQRGQTVQSQINIGADYDREDAHREAWALGDYCGECPNCKRHRLCECPNGKRRCEKCNWSPELGGYVPMLS